MSAGANAAGSEGRVPDVGRGLVLYEQHCIVCHTPGIHARQDKLPATRDEMEDIVEYLNRTRYRFPPDK